MDCSLPGSSVHGISQARAPECIAIFFSRGPSQHRDWIHISSTGRVILCHCTSKEAYACVLHMHTHSFREASHWEATHQGKKPHIRKKRPGQDGVRKNVSYRRASHQAILRLISWVLLLHWPPHEGWKKRRLLKTEAERGRGAELVCGVKIPLPRQSRGQGFTVCHAEFWSIPSKTVRLGCLAAEILCFTLSTFSSQSPWSFSPECILWTF